MIQITNPSKTWDRIIVGAGILGLWHARHAIRRGENILVLDKREVGSGASGGFLGALMPHMPDAWNGKKKFQYEGLSTIDDAIAELQSDTGIDCGYRRCGRIMPVVSESMLSHVAKRTSSARERWEARYQMHHIADVEDANLPRGWISSEAAVLGLQKDSFSARVNPREYLAALKAFVSINAELRERTSVQAIDAKSSSVLLAEGGTLSANKIVVASGWEAYELLQPFMGPSNADKPIGRGVKGQAVLVAFDHDDSLPIVYHDGVYVVPHAGNRVAIGSTSVNDWQNSANPEPGSFNYSDMDFYKRAMELVPVLSGAPILDHWAGVRPRNMLEGRGTSPWFGPVPGHENLIALIGGFKITFGIAHLEQIFA